MGKRVVPLRDHGEGAVVLRTGQAGDARAEGDAAEGGLPIAAAVSAVARLTPARYHAAML